MEGGPYREMPLPPTVRPRNWWRIAEWAVAAFNAYAFVDGMAEAMSGKGTPHGMLVWALFLLFVPCPLAILGFLMPVRRQLRALLITPSAFVWSLVAMMYLSSLFTGDVQIAGRTLAMFLGEAAAGVLSLRAVYRLLRPR